MIKHLPEGLVPFEDCGFAREPYMPLIGMPITVFCRLDGIEAAPVLRLVTDDSERTVSGERAGDRRYAFRLGAYGSAQTLRYRIEAGGESTREYICEVLKEETLTGVKTVYRTDKGYELALADDITLCLGADASITVVARRAEGAACQSGELALGGGMTLSTSYGSIWQLKRLSIPLMEATAYRVLRNGEGMVRHITLEATCGARHIFGTGERFDAVERSGRESDIIVAEKFTHQGDQTYLPVPFFFTEQGYGWYRQSDIPVKMRFGGRMTVAQETEGDVLSRDRIIIGTPARVLNEFIGMTGRPALPPEWALGVWISGNGWSCDAEVDAQLNALKDNDYPASVMVLEQWSDERTFYLWHGEHWSDPAAMVRRVREAGLHLLLWQIPVVKHEWDGEPGEALTDDTREAVERGCCVKNADGSPYRITENWFHNSLLPDFTNPEAVDWWFGKRRYLLQMGVEGFKTDGGEFLFDKTARLYDGTSGLRARNLYPMQYARAYNDFMRREGVSGVTFSRAGFTGAQTAPIHWAGDQKSEWSELSAQLCAGISAGLSGVIFWSFDIGGFAGDIPEAELYLRATAMGCFCPVMQWHSEPRGGQYSGGMGEGYNNDRSPWNLAEKLNDRRVLTIACEYARMREKLRPYLWREANECVSTGRPMMAHLCLDYPDDARAWETDDEYMLGRELLAAPITERGAEGREVYLPEGEWRDVFTGERYGGSQRLYIACPLERALVFHKEKLL